MYSGLEIGRSIYIEESKMPKLETVRVSRPDHPNKFVWINKSDFKETDVLYSDGTVKKSVVKKSTKKAK